MLILKSAVSLDIPAEMVIKRLGKISAGGVRHSRDFSKFRFFLIMKENRAARGIFEYCFVSGRTDKKDQGCQVEYHIYPGPLFWLICTALLAFLILTIKSMIWLEAGLLAAATVLICLTLQVSYLERAGNRAIMSLLCDNKTYYYI